MKRGLARMKADSMCAIVVRVEELDIAPFGDVEITTLADEGVRHDGVGTMFVWTIAGGRVEVGGTMFPIPSNGYAVLSSSGVVYSECGIAVVHRGHRGLFSIGGPIEDRGRLAYIDGCSDTVLVSPVVRGDPCLNLLHLPVGTVQTDHDHPSLRIGLVMSGRGTCVLEGKHRFVLQAGIAFVLPPATTHRFETGSDALRIIAWHPDSDTGPTDDDHPMLNRTLRPGSADRVR